MLDLQSQLAIQLKDLVVGFDGKTVIDHLELDVTAGQIFGLVGASGAGKSVLLRAILGLIPKQLGAIEIFGLERDPLAENCSTVGSFHDAFALQPF